MQSFHILMVLVKAAGIGGPEIDDDDVKKAALISFGLKDVLHENFLHELFITGLMENETYKLCASI